MEEELDPELIGPEQSFFYPQHIDLDLKRDLGDDDSFDVDDGEHSRQLVSIKLEVNASTSTIEYVALSVFSKNCLESV